MLLCAWHIQRNLVSHLSGLAKKDKDLYDLLLSLPFVTCQEKFESIIEKANSSNTITQGELDYLEEKLKTKRKWSKSYTKHIFTGGICTTSRVEGLHGILRNALNSSSALTTVFSCFKMIEETELTKFKEEFNRHSRLQIQTNSNPVLKMKEQFSDYVYRKMIDKFNKSLAYRCEPLKKKSTW